MVKDFQSGQYWLERTDIKEKLYCGCFVPINIDKWFNRIRVKPEMNALLLQIYREIGCMEGLNALKEYGEMQDINSLIDRINVMHCQPDGKQVLDAIHFFSDIYEEESIKQDDKIQIELYFRYQFIKTPA